MTRRQLIFPGHILRNSQIEIKITQHKARDGQFIKCIGSLTKRLEKPANVIKLLINTNDRIAWRSMIAYVTKYGT